MKKSELRKLIREVIDEQGPFMKNVKTFRPSSPPTKEQFQTLLTQQLKDGGYSDDEIAKLHPLIWIVIGATFVKWLDNQIDDE